MVLQQEKPLKVWGWADPGAEVKVTLTESRDDALAAVGAEALQRETPEEPGSDGEPKPHVRIEYVDENAPEFATLTDKATAGADGRWEVVLEPLEASFRPKFLCAAAGDEKIALLDILVGEVWVTAGQSNMAWSGDKTGWINKQGLLLPGVRYAHTGKKASYQPLTDLPERAEWLPCTGEAVRSLSTIPYLFGKYLHGQLQVPVGIINAASGGAHGNFWCSLDEMHAIDFWAVKKMMATHDEAVAAWDDDASREKILADYEKKYATERAAWEKEVATAKAEGQKKLPKEPAHKPPTAPLSPYKISCLYNGRIVPIGPLAIRGALYLQGEQQVLTWCTNRYAHIFPRIITSFRDAFGDDELPFGIITLQGAGHNKMPITEIGAANRSAIVREMHYKTHLATPHTGFICAHDVGRGLHPNWKRPLAERAVHWALRDVYKTVQDNSHSVDKIEYKDGRAYLHITQSKTQKKRQGRETVETVVRDPVGFAPWSGNDEQFMGGFLIAGEDKRWYPARVGWTDAKTDGFKALVVWSDLVDQPVALRYGWGSFPVANIGPWENPLPPFRTDDWPVTQAFSVDPDGTDKYRSAWYEELYGRYDDMLDRTIRQGSIDAARSEMLLHGNGAKILARKAERIADILLEIDPEFYRNDKLLELDHTDWTIRRAHEARLAGAKKAPEQIETLLEDENLRSKIKALRKALDDYRKAVDALEQE